MNTAISVDPGEASRLASALAGIVGSANCSVERADREFHSTDVLSAGATATAVVAPGTVEELASVVRCCTEAGFAVVARGAGLSYTGGYTPTHERTVSIDMQRLDAIVEVNATDMYVTVQTGCSWKKLEDTLLAQGLRTPYWGPVSGHSSTVGGALSQGSIYYGSARYGTTADSVLNLEVVLADGTRVLTGSASARNLPSPFFRNYGPDLAGPFLHDSGALGIKATATLRLIRAPAVTDFLSFALDDYQAATATLSEIARRNLASECYVFDPFMHGLRLKRESLLQDFRHLASVMRAGKSLLSGARDAARIALAGRSALSDVRYAMHVMLEGRNAAQVAAEVAEVRALAASRGGRELEPTLPKVQRANPFFSARGNGTLNPEGMRYLPVHGICPHSRADAFIEALLRVMGPREQEMIDKRVEWGFVMCAVSTHAVLIEPLIFWEDAASEFHARIMEPGYLGTLPRHAANAEGTALVKVLASELKVAFEALGCAHLQIGKSYPYREGRAPATWALLESLKKAVDPGGLMNPGALGLD